MKNKVLIGLMSALLLMTAGAFTLADDGMWMPHQMKDLDLKKLGLQMDPENLFKKDGTGLMSAVVNIGGGTGEFVSPEGLILTNHHVAFGALQRAATPENDYIADGFIAWDRPQEIPAQGYIIDVLLGYDDVTEEILASVKKGMTSREKHEAIDTAQKKAIARVESQAPDLRATMAVMYSGNKYYLFRFKRLKDIRLVYAPPQDLGNFGGDIDNWMWPRHTCDFTFLRAYVSPDNIGTDFSSENLPYKPKSFLPISTKSVNEGDFSFIMGYPGRTYRNNMTSEMVRDISYMKERIDLYQDIIAFLEKAGEGNRDIQIRYAGKIKGLNNGLKNYQGKLEGMAKINLVELKKKKDREFLEWANETPERKKIYGTVIADMEAFLEKTEADDKKNQVLGQLTSSYFSSAVLSEAMTIVRTSQERQKPDMERESAYQERNLDNLRMRVRLAEKSYEIETDRALLKYNLKKFLGYPENQLPDALKSLMALQSESAVDSYVDGLFDRTCLSDPEKRLELMEKSPKELKKLNDPILDLAFNLEAEMKDLRENGKALSQEKQDIRGRYLKALLERNEGRLAPDANSTIRFTYGNIEGYSPRDAVNYSPQTTLTGIIEKDTGSVPFHVPEKLKELYQARDFGSYTDPELDDIPACFLNTTNVTGGNSGSPTLNAKGEQIGILFDMTYESVTGDYYIIPELQRAISVDILFVLFVTEKFSGAAHIIQELTLR